MSLFLRTIMSEEIDSILNYESLKLNEGTGADLDRQIQSWNARWRKESLEHYLAMGWSFLAKDAELTNNDKEGELVGYFIAQPLLFFDGFTQSLWIEYLSYSTLKARDELCDLAYRMAREKHLQKVYFPQSSGIQNCLSTYKAESWKPNVLSLQSTKMG